MAGLSVWLRRKEAAAYLKENYNISRTPGTLAKMAVIGGGPKFQHAGRIPMYPVKELDEYAHSLFSPIVDSTSAAKALREAKINYATN